MLNREWYRGYLAQPAVNLLEEEGRAYGVSSV